MDKNWGGFQNPTAGEAFSSMVNRQGVTPGGGQMPVGGFSPHPQGPYGWRGGMNGGGMNHGQMGGYPNPNQGPSFRNPYTNAPQGNPIYGKNPMTAGQMEPEGRVPYQRNDGPTDSFGPRKSGGPLGWQPEGRVPRENNFGAGAMPEDGAGLQTGGFNFQSPMGGWGGNPGAILPMASPVGQMGQGWGLGAPGWDWSR